MMISGSGETPVTLHLARLALGFGASMLAVTSQFGGSLFEQSALLLLDAVVLDVTAEDPAGPRPDEGPAYQQTYRGGG